MVLPNITTQACTSAFVFEHDGAGEQDLFGSSAGHCAQGTDKVFDNLVPWTQAGDTVAPNLWRATSPADADSVQFSLDFTRGNVVPTIIRSTSSAVDVVGKLLPADYVSGMTVYYSGRVSGENPGLLDGTTPDTYSETDHNWFTTAPSAVTKGVHNMYCFSATTGMGGDSGAPVYHFVSNPFAAEAIGILSGARSEDNYICFTPTSNLGNATNSHIWTGD
jgi:hypothetical protein